MKHSMLLPTLLVLAIGTVAAAFAADPQPAPPGEGAPASSTPQPAPPGGKVQPAPAATPAPANATAPEASQAPSSGKGSPSAQPSGSSPQHFEPSEKVRPDFDVSFPVDI